MKKRYSNTALLFLLVLFLGFRAMHFSNNDRNGYNATTWDAFGYYMYLPSVFIYNDVRDLKWVSNIDSNYKVTGGVFYQAIHQESGKYTNKYLCGVSLMQAPFFFVGHMLAKIEKVPQDGFSWPYQYALIFGAIAWAMLGFIVLSKVLLKFFDDQTTAVTLLLIGCCSNIIQYISIDAAQSHVWIFTLYSLVLWYTIKWHERPRWIYAGMIGLICGLAVIARPTELIIVCIPLFWAIHHKTTKNIKWALVAQYKYHVAICCIAGIIGVLPQLLYWQYTTGSLIYDVGSKWYFLNPWFRVLFGPEKGWFVYTPITILMVLGLVFMKKYPFQKSVLIFCLLNLWIIMAWSDWRYGGSYSTRALVQSYPVFALALASIVQILMERKKIYLVLAVGALLVVLNFYQLQIYNSGVGEGFSPLLHFLSR